MTINKLFISFWGDINFLPDFLKLFIDTDFLKVFGIKYLRIVISVIVSHIKLNVSNWKKNGQGNSNNNSTPMIINPSSYHLSETVSD